MRSVQDAIFPQQGHMPRLQQAKGHETGRVHQRVGTAWPQQSGYPSGNSFGEATHSGNKPKGPAQALATARQQLAQARAAAMPEACLRILENEVQQQKTAMKQAQPLGQKMDQTRARFRRAVESGEKAMQALQKAQENFEQAHSLFKDPNCDICLKTKITRASCRRRAGTVVPRVENFGDMITADHNVLSEESESRNNHRNAVVVEDLATQWKQSDPCKTKSSQETQKSLQNIFEPTRKPKVLYTDNSSDFGKACEESLYVNTSP